MEKFMVLYYFLFDISHNNFFIPKPNRSGRCNPLDLKEGLQYSILVLFLKGR